MQQSLDPTSKGNSLFAEVQLCHRYLRIYEGEKKYFISFISYIALKILRVSVPDLASMNLYFSNTTVLNYLGTDLCKTTFIHALKLGS